MSRPSRRRRRRERDEVAAMAEARLLLAELDALRGELGRPHGRGAKRRGEARCGAVWAESK